MKLHEVANLKKVEVKPEAPSLFARRQAGPLLSRYERKQIKQKLKQGHLPRMLKRQAESIE